MDLSDTAQAIQTKVLAVLRSVLILKQCVRHLIFLLYYVKQVERDDDQLTSNQKKFMPLYYAT